MKGLSLKEGMGLEFKHTAVYKRGTVLWDTTFPERIWDDRTG